jgi:hypothetical protein
MGLYSQGGLYESSQVTTQEGVMSYPEFLKHTFQMQGAGAAAPANFPFFLRAAASGLRGVPE